MSYIAPNTNIYLLHNVPLDNTYEHTLYFAGSGNSGREAQANFFRNNYLKKSFTNQSYQRVRRGWLKIQANAEEIYDCNYLMFKSTRSVDGNSYGKWYYCFINAVEYVNENVTEISYEIDYMQTWYFDYTVKQCFVEREHTATDNLYEHIIEEDVDCGPDLKCQKVASKDFSDMSVIIVVNRIYVDNGQTVKATPEIRNNVYMNTKTFDGFDLSDPNVAQSIAATLDNLGEDEIIDVYQYPRVLRTDSSVGADYRYFDSFRFTPANTIDGYVPKNNKLFNYPYHFIQVGNNTGDVLTLKCENWNSGDVGWFWFDGVRYPNPVISCKPEYYLNANGITESELNDGSLGIGSAYNYNNTIVLSEFPTCAFSGSAYKDWLARNKNQLKYNYNSILYDYFMSGLRQIPSSVNNIYSMAGTALRGITPNSTGVVDGANLAQSGLSLQQQISSNVLGNAVNMASRSGNALMSAYGMIASIKDRQNVPPHIQGQVSSANLTSALKKYRFNFYDMSIRAEYAKIIDDYFTRFGYACKKIKTPSISNRPHWNYVKTVNCCAVGSVPADDMKAICSIYDNGITFWKNASEIGNYSLDNSPV